MKEYSEDFVNYVDLNAKDIISHLTRTHNFEYTKEEGFFIGSSIEDNPFKEELICDICSKYKLMNTHNNPMMERFIGHMWRHYKKGEGII